MSSVNRRIVQSVIDSIDRFIEGGISLGGLQSALQSGLGALERSPARFTEMIRLAEADLEEIRFTMLLEEQKSAATFLVDSLRAELESGVAREET